MKNFVFVSILILLIVSITSAAEVPNYVVGEWWEWDVTVDRNESTVKRSGRLGNGVYRGEITDSGFDIDSVFAEGRPSIYNPASIIEWLRFPLKVGAGWGAHKWFRSTTQEWIYPKMAVETFESVSVPAGKFMAYKIVTEEGWRTTTYWWSDQTKSVIKIYQVQFRGNDEVNPTNIVLKNYGIKTK